MAMGPNSRILVRFGTPADAGPSHAVLVEDGVPADTLLPAAIPVARFALPATSHPLGCACCLPRGPVAVALGRLFLARARGEAPLFDTVIAVTRGAAGAVAVRTALTDDVVTSARFRLAP